MNENEVFINEIPNETSLYNKHYIQIDHNDNIVYGWSDGPTKDVDIGKNSICINEHGDYQFQLFPDGEQNPPLMNMMGIYLYKYDRVLKTIIPKTAEEIEAEVALIPPPPPSRLDKIEATQDFIAAMMDIDLEE